MATLHQPDNIPLETPPHLHWSISRILRQIPILSLDTQFAPCSSISAKLGFISSMFGQGAKSATPSTTKRTKALISPLSMTHPVRSTRRHQTCLPIRLRQQLRHLKWQCRLGWRLICFLITSFWRMDGWTIAISQKACHHSYGRRFNWRKGQITESCGKELYARQFRRST